MKTRIPQTNWRRFAGQAALIASVLVITPLLANAYNSYRSEVPYGTTFSCNMCHISSNNLTRIQFGKDFASAGHNWTQALAMKDSDGDGYSNGVEVQDARGLWTQGSGNPGSQAYISNPGVASSLPAIPLSTEIAATITGSIPAPTPSDINNDGVIDTADLMGIV